MTRQSVPGFFGISLLAVRHGIFEMKLLVLAETQRPVEMTADVVAELKMALLTIKIHQQMIYFHQIILLVLAEKSAHTLHMGQSDPQQPLSNQRG